MDSGFFLHSMELSLQYFVQGGSHKDIGGISVIYTFIMMVNPRRFIALYFPILFLIP